MADPGRRTVARRSRAVRVLAGGVCAVSPLAARRDRRPYQVAGGDIVALLPAREVENRLGPVKRRPDPLAGEQVAGHILDACSGTATTSREHRDLAAGVHQERHDVTPQRARATGDQDPCCHGFSFRSNRKTPRREEM